MEGVVIFTVVLVAIAAGIYSIADAWRKSTHPDNSDKNDLD